MERLFNIALDVSRHCIETAIRREYNHCVNRYFNQPQERKSLEKRIAVLKKALERFDFPSLRSCYPSLAGGQSRNVFLTADAVGHIFLVTPEEEIRL